VTLTEDHGNHDDDGEADSSLSTHESLQRAITRGIGVAGRPLDPLMPRWKMSPDDLANLVEFLQNLGSE
jgi:hypothetical protein